MKTQNRIPAVVLLIGALLLSAGCRSARPSSQAEATKADTAAAAQEIQRVADAVMGKQSEIIARGDLAGTGMEQMLVVNRFGQHGRQSMEAGNTSEMFITRAAILEEKKDKWVEVLLCDEHLKNPIGYLEGAPAGRVMGWLLELKPDARRGLELRFTPAEASRERPSQPRKSGSPTVAVRWNKYAKRYQALDQFHDRYLGETPMLETPQSLLR